MNTEERVITVKNCLQMAFNPKVLQVIDNSAQHKNHPGAADGRSHFAVTIVSDAFNDKPLIEQHRMIYSALGTLMETDIHALQIKIQR